MLKKITLLAVLLAWGAPMAFGAALPGESAPSATPGSALPLLTPEPNFGTAALDTESVAESAPASAPTINSALPEPSTAPVDSSFIETPKPIKTFRIGYLPRTGEGGLTESHAHNLRRWLEENRQIRSALRASGYSGQVSFQPADGHNDLRNGLETRQFDLAFCPAIVFATIKPGYRVIFQEKHERDTWDARGSGQILRQGVIFVGPRSSLFAKDFSERELKDILSRKHLAVPSAYDAAGYQYPMLALANEFQINPGAVHLRFCGSSEEVVKHVVSGLAEVGACDRAVLESWLPRVLPDSVFGNNDKPPLERLVRILPIEVPLVPTDPVVILGDLHPEVSEVGRRIKEELPKFFDELDAEAPFALEKRAKDSFYEGIQADLELLDSKLRGQEAIR